MEDPQPLGSLVAQFPDGVRTVSGRDEGNKAWRELTCEDCSDTFMWQPPWHNGRFHEEWAPSRCSPCVTAFQKREDEESQAEMAERRARERLKARLAVQGEASHLGARLTRAHFASFRVTCANRDALRTAKSWLDADAVTNLVILGPIGSGKSYLAACLFNALIGEEKPALWVRVAEFLSQIKRGFSDEEERERAARLYRLAQEADVLFLDDVGKTHPGRDSSWVEEQLFGIIDARYCEELPTVATTEWTAAGLAERIGDSVVSRLEHGAMLAGMKEPKIPYRRPKEDA